MKETNQFLFLFISHLFFIYKCFNQSNICSMINLKKKLQSLKTNNLIAFILYSNYDGVIKAFAHLNHLSFLQNR